MTVPVPDQLEYISDADGVTKTFPYPKRFLQKDEIVVLLRDADGVDTVQRLNIDYTIAGSSWPNGGDVVFGVAPASGLKVVRYRMTQAKQTVDLENKQRNDAPSVETQLDRLTMAIQDRDAAITRVGENLSHEEAQRIAGDHNLQLQIDVINQELDDVSEDVARAEVAAQQSEEAKNASEQAKEDTEALLAGAQDALQKAETAVQPDRQIIAGDGLEGGGDFSQDRTVGLSEDTISALGKARSSVQSVNDVEPDEAGNVTISAPVADGSITDSKLPDFSGTSSPSTAKMRFQASSAAGALAGAIQRPVNLKLSERLDAADFGVKADGTTDDTAAMVAALREAEHYGRPLFLPAGVIMVNPNALFIGTGAEEVNSAYNNQTIIGVGSSPAFMSGTVIRARSAGGILFDVRGLINGVTLSGIIFDCANVVQYGVRIRSMSESNWSQFSVRNFTGIGVDWNCRANPSGSPTWSSGNVWQQFYITSSVVADYGVGLLLDGQISTNKDPHRNTFNTGIIQINKGTVNPTFALQLNMTDSNTFIEVDADTVGSGIGYGLRLSALTSNGFPFPQNNFFYGCSIKGYDVAEDAGTGKLIGQNMFINMTTMDGETLPTHPKLVGFTDTGVFFYSPVISGTLPGYELKSRNGSARYRIFANVSDTVDGGFEIQKLVSGTWTSYLRIASNGALFTLIPALGLKQIQAGDPDTGGSGFRRLVVSN